MDKNGFVNEKTFNAIGNEDLKRLAFVDLTFYDSFTDPEELKNFLEEGIGQSQIEVIREQVSSVLNIQGKLTDSQLNDILIQAQRLQSAGYMKPVIQEISVPYDGIYEEFVYPEEPEAKEEPLPEEDSETDAFGNSREDVIDAIKGLIERWEFRGASPEPSDDFNKAGIKDETADECIDSAKREAGLMDAGPGDYDKLIENNPGLKEALEGSDRPEVKQWLDRYSP